MGLRIFQWEINDLQNVIESDYGLLDHLVLIDYRKAYIVCHWECQRRTLIIHRYLVSETVTVGFYIHFIANDDVELAKSRQQPMLDEKGQLKLQ